MRKDKLSEYVVQIWYSAKSNRLYLAYFDFTDSVQKDYCYLFIESQPDSAIIIAINDLFTIVDEEGCLFIDSYESSTVNSKKEFYLLEGNPAVLYNAEKDMLGLGRFGDNYFVIERNNEYTIYTNFKTVKDAGWELIGGLA